MAMTRKSPLLAGFPITAPNPSPLEPHGNKLGPPYRRREKWSGIEALARDGMKVHHGREQIMETRYGLKSPTETHLLVFPPLGSNPTLPMSRLSLAFPDEMALPRKDQHLIWNIGVGPSCY
jgi:hypothetical protein